MKLLTCVVPCYNSAAYMERAVDSLLAGGEEIEVIIVNDGSTDEPGTIADRLAGEHPTVIRVHHQENAGHGSAINYGIANAQGIYFKVVDSDDRLLKENVPGLMDVLRKHSDEAELVDLIFHDYVYDRAEKENSFRITYLGKLKPDTISDWDRCRPFHIWNQFMIHSLIYRTQFLRDIELRLPEHTYYEDNLYIYRPLVYTKRIMYHHAPIYGYFVGRSDQSINEKNLLKRLDQMTEITKKQITSYTLEELNRVSPHLRKYMLNNAGGQLFTNCALQFIEDSEQSHRMNREMWQSIREFDPALYKRLRRNPLGRVSCLPGRAGERFLVFIYRAGRKLMRL